MEYHSTYKGAKIFKLNTGGYIAQLEDGYYTYSILTYEAHTLKGVKDQVNGYYAQIASNYK